MLKIELKFPELEVINQVFYLYINLTHIYIFPLFKLTSVNTKINESSFFFNLDTFFWHHEAVYLNRR